jgi:hemoglobin/transferrin/lactoferrin receptor protein
LNILSDTRQQVWTPGVDVQATFLTNPTNVVTAGLTVYQDRSEDERTTSTETTMIGQVALGQFGPAATVFPTPTVLGPASITHPVRVPNATFRDTGVFVHDEWQASRDVRVTGGIRVDGYRVRTDNTPGYDIASLIAGATPAIDPTTLADINGQTISRTAFTGEAGVVVLPDRPVSFFSHYVRSYRHPNLEELLFAGTATAGSIVPNVKVEPETGHNVDVGARFQTPHFTGSLSYFNNSYRNFISTEPVAAVTSQSGPSSISQAINLARVRIQGVELAGSAPISAGAALLMPSGSFAYNTGTVLSGTSPLSQLSLAGEPQDNITPWKAIVGVRASDRRERWWVAYNIRSQGEVTRVSPLLDESSFLIAQDLLGLAGFTVHRASIGYDWERNGERLGLALVFDNLTDEFYREQFQFAPARGRTVALSFSVRGGK